MKFESGSRFELGPQQYEPGRDTPYMGDVINLYSESKGKVVPVLIKHHAMKMYWRVEVQLGTRWR